MEKPSASTHQEYWDACLIKTWRNCGTMIDAFKMFKSITGVRSDSLTLLRLPGDRYSKYMRPFVASCLPRISEWLLRVGPEHDVALLKKLAASTYDTKLAVAHPVDAEKKKLYAEMRRNKQINEFNLTKALHRNDDTNGGVMKGTRTRRAR